MRQEVECGPNFGNAVPDGKTCQKLSGETEAKQRRGAL